MNFDTFEIRLKELYKTRELTPAGVKTNLWRWKKAKEIISSVPEMRPKHWHTRQEEFHNAALKARVTPGALVPVFTLINDYGQLLAAEQGDVYLRLKRPSGYIMQKIVEATKGQLQASRPMTREDLAKIKGSMKKKHYNFFFACFVLGLRPSELQRAKTMAGSYQVVQEKGHTLLEVWQGKLKMVRESDRWKVIPIVDDEQKQALQILQKKDFAKPCPATVRRHMGEGFGTYAGRKGFADDMTSKGWAFTDASKMLGHLSVKTTEDYYADRANRRRLTALDAIGRKAG